jgi:hypothetical protein
MSANETERREGGFELDGRFYPWRFSEMGKDLMLIDRIAGMGLVEFSEATENGLGELRAGILLTLIATSLRAGNPEWSVERIVRTVEDLNLSDLTLMGGAEKETESPPTVAPTPDGDGAPSRSPSNGSSSSPTPPVSSDSEAWSEIPT